MKPHIVTIALFAALLASSLADAAPRANPATVAKRTAKSDADARKKMAIAHIKQKRGAYGDAIVADKRFAIDPTMFARSSNQPGVPHRKPKRYDYDYDYVFSS